jgi:hypothetical protein
MLTSAHSEQAIAVSRETGWDLDDYAAERHWAGVALGPVGQHRDSDALDRSNFTAVLADLQDKYPDAVDTVSFGHWAVGWVEEIASDAGNVELQAAIQEWRDALEDYPVADEDAFCALEYDEALETIENCHSRSWREDCGPCGEVWFELADDLPDDWASQVFSAMFDAGEDTSPDGMRGKSIDRALIYCGFAAPEGD